MARLLGNGITMGLAWSRLIAVAAAMAGLALLGWMPQRQRTGNGKS